MIPSTHCDLKIYMYICILVDFFQIMDAEDMNKSYYIPANFVWFHFYA